jgi:alcohol dehydrogenase class IV
VHGVLRLPKETLFGRGALASLVPIAGRLGRRILLCSDVNILAQPQVSAVARALAKNSDACIVFDEVEPDLPLATVDRCMALAERRDIDLVIGLGGGSCLDAAKIAALLLRHPGPLDRYYDESAVPGPTLPVIAVPTTAGTGSEVTPVAVVGDPGRRLKVGVSSAELIPRVAICDPELTLSCPPSVTAFSGIDALAHAVEAFTAKRRPRAWETYPGAVFQGKTVFSDRFALAAVSAMGAALERAVAQGDDLEAREQMLYGSLCAGIAFGNAGTAGAHALQYPIGAATSTPHGLGVGLLLPYVLRYTRDSCRSELEQVAAALGIERTADAAIAEIARLAAAVGVPRTLAEIGVSEDELPEVAAQAAGVTRLVSNSPRELDSGALLSILREAWAGAAVAASI